MNTCLPNPNPLNYTNELPDDCPKHATRKKIKKKPYKQTDKQGNKV